MDSLDYGNMNVQALKEAGYAEFEIGKLAMENSELRQQIKALEDKVQELTEATQS
jgi:ribosomal protein L1